MRLKILQSIAGVGFAFGPGDETEHFSKGEAERLVEAGFAEKAPLPVAKRPETKKEWDEERARLIEEHSAAIAAAESANARITALEAIIAELSAFRSSVIAALGTPAVIGVETMDAPVAAETRG